MNDTLQPGQGSDGIPQFIPMQQLTYFKAVRNGRRTAVKLKGERRKKVL